MDGAEYMFGTDASQCRLLPVHLHAYSEEAAKLYRTDEVARAYAATSSDFRACSRICRARRFILRTGC
jgi:hypothetical protein